MNVMNHNVSANTSVSDACALSPAAQASRSSFYWALRLLPLDRRNAMFRIYAFCREVDDIADNPGEAADKMQRLEHWRAAIDSLYQAEKPAPGVACLKPIVERYGLDRSDFMAVIDGMETDARDTVRMADGVAFDQYLDRVACAVGRMSDKVFGVSGPAADRLAHHLGRALQITNILRDLEEDAARDRLYIPQDLLSRHGIASDDVRAVLAHPQLVNALSDLADQALSHYDQAAEALSNLSKSKTRPARVMMAVYRRIFERLVGRGLANTSIAVDLSKREKLWLAFRHGVL